MPRRLPAIALGLFLLVAAPLALASSSANQDIPFSPVGRDQKVAVVSCLYKGDKLQSYDVSAETWARVLDDKLNKYFVEASEGSVTFDFVPIPSFCIFDEKYSETTPPALLGSGFDIEDDPLTIFREAGQAILYADGKIPGRSTWGGTDINRLLVIVNRPKRGRATMPPGLVYETGSSGPKNITVSVISSVQDPVRANGSSTTPGKRGTTEGILNDEDIALVAHELGHQLGLPDLYNDEDGGREHTELWDPMGFQTLQEFSAFSRYLPGWLGEYRTRIVERGTPPEGVEVTLVPRGGPSPRGATDAVLIPTTGPILPQPRGFAYKQTFDGYILEARAHEKLDATRIAQREDGVTGSAGRWCDTNGLPEIYKEGVLVTATRGAPATLLPLNPLTVKRSGPLGRTGSCDKAGKLDDAELAEAPYQVGQTFSDPDAGLRVKVLEKFRGGMYSVRIHFTPPPAPNLVATDAWLDSTANGYDTYWTPDNDGDGAPDLFGDPVYTPASVTLSLTAPPQVSFSTTTHRLSLRVQNSGNAAARGVTGTAYILGGEIPIGSELNGETLSRLAVGRVDGIRFGDIAAGATATRTVDITPVGPFVVALVVDRLQSEDVGTDNTRIEPFLAVQTGSGSPYKPVDVSLRVANLDRRGNVVYASAGELPAGWKGSLDATTEPGRVHAVLKAGGKETFRLKLQPPDPAVAKPGQVKEIPLTGYMSHGDSYVPVVKVPVAVVLSYGTALTLSARVSAGATQLGGRLT